jgi:peptide/nickel transport system permease protein
MITFALYYTIPADPAGFLVDVQKATPAQVAQARHQLGVDRSIYIQYGKFVWRAVHGDLGISFQSARAYFASGDGDPVGRTLVRAAGVTGSLVLGGAVLLLLLAIPFGALAASRPGSFLDRAIVAFSLAGISTHPLVVGLVLQLFAGNRWHLTPANGYCSFFSKWPSPHETVRFGASSDKTPCSGPLHWASHLVLPWVTFALFFVALYLRMVRASMLEVLEEPYVRTARAKGASERRVLRRHALPNAILPIVTMIGMDIGTAVGVSIYIETVFGLPGLGRTTLTALNGGVGYDLPVIVGIVLVTGAAIILLNILVDLLYVVFDPRIAAEPNRGRQAALGRLV